MHVKLKVSHANQPNAEAVVHALATAFGESDPSTLDRSDVFVPDARPVMLRRLVFAAQPATYRMIILRSDNSELDVVIEETSLSSLPLGAGNLWRKISEALNELRPKLKSATLDSERSGATLLVGRFGAGYYLTKDTILQPLAVLIVSVVFVIFASHTFAVNRWQPMLAAFVATAVTLAYFLVKSLLALLRRAIVWEVARGNA